MEGGKDPFNRRTFPWGGEDARILAFFREISRLRAASSDLLAHGYYRVLHAQGTHLVLSREGEGEALLLLLNAGEFLFSYSLPQGGAVEVAPMDFLWKRISK